MSGGHFNYQQYRLEDLAEEVDRLIETNSDFRLNEYGEAQGRFYPDEIIAHFRETSHALRRAGEMLQRVDWLVEGDDGKEDFLERWSEEVRPEYGKSSTEQAQSKHEASGKQN